MRDIPFTETITRYIEESDEDIEIVVEGYYSVGSSGRYYGPPENCYPGEGASLEVTRAYTRNMKYTMFLTGTEEEELLEILGSQHGRDEGEAREFAKEAAGEARYEAEKNGDFDDEVRWEPDDY